MEILKASETPRRRIRQPTGPTPPATSPDKGLSLSAVGLISPVKTGKELTYEIRVANVSTATTYQQIAVKAVVPNGHDACAAWHHVENDHEGVRRHRLVDFDAAPDLAPGKSLTYRVRVLAKQVGDYHFHAELTARAWQSP